RGQRQLEFPVFEGWSILVTSCTQEVCDGHGWSSAEAVSGLGFREVVGGGGQEGWDGRKDGTQVSRVGLSAQRPEAAAHVSNANRSARPTVAEGPSEAGSGASPAGQDAVRLAAERASRTAHGEPTPHVRAARPAVAVYGRFGPHGHVQPGALRRRLGG